MLIEGDPGLEYIANPAKGMLNKEIEG